MKKEFDVLCLPAPSGEIIHIFADSVRRFIEEFSSEDRYSYKLDVSEHSSLYLGWSPPLEHESRWPLVGVEFTTRLERGNLYRNYKLLHNGIVRMKFRFSVLTHSSLLVRNRVFEKKRMPKEKLASDRSYIRKINTWTQFVSAIELNELIQNLADIYKTHESTK